MNFDEAFIAMKDENKKIKLPDRDYFLQMISKIYYDGDDNRPADIIGCADILREDWEIVEGKQ